MDIVKGHFILILLLFYSVGNYCPDILNYSNSEKNNCSKYYYVVYKEHQGRHMNMRTLVGWSCDFNILNTLLLSCRNKMFVL